MTDPAVVAGQPIVDPPIGKPRPYVPEVMFADLPDVDPKFPGKQLDVELSKIADALAAVPPSVVAEPPAIDMTPIKAAQDAAAASAVEAKETAASTLATTTAFAEALAQQAKPAPPPVVPEPQIYPTIAAAEDDIAAAGYVRDKNRHIWVNPQGKTAKVVRTLFLQFSIEWS